LAVGREQGRATADIDLTFHALRSSEQGALPFARGPSQGLVVYGWTTDAKSELHSVVVATGDDHLLYSTTNIVHDAVWDATTRTVIFTMLDRATRRPLGVFVLEAGESDPRAIFGAWQQGETRGALVHTPFLSAGDRRLAIVSCATACDVRASGPDATGPLRLIASGLPSRIVFGIAGTTLWMESACEAPCKATGIDLRTGQKLDGPEYCQVVVPLDDPVDPVVLTDVAPNGSCSQGAYDVRTTSAITMDSWQPVHAEPAGPRLVVHDAWELPRGLFLLAEDGVVGPLGPEAGLVVNARDGQTQSFPAASKP
jgi:hypothetical protein